MAHEIHLPISISFVGGKYLLFDIDVVSWLRRNHRICGVMSGTLPQSPSQNIFLGLPMQIMPEEAQLLVEKGVAYITDDSRIHEQAMRSGDANRHADYIRQIRRKAEAASKLRAGQKDEQRKQALGKQKPQNKKSANSEEQEDDDNDGETPLTPTRTGNDSEDPQMEPPLLFDNDNTVPPSSLRIPQSFVQLNSITPTTSHLFLPPPQILEPPSSLSSTSQTTQSITIHNLPPSYPLYRHLNSKFYFQTPGLRFGCQYCVYPGDPLRFHSHFLAVSFQWDQEINLMDLVGGGRLGTGVKKGFLIGGVVEEGGGVNLQRGATVSRDIVDDADRSGAAVDGADGGKDGAQHEKLQNLEHGSREEEHEVGRRKAEEKRAVEEEVKVRTFSIEWAAM